MPDTLRIFFAGLCLDLAAPPSTFLRDDSLWRLHRHYEAFLATCNLPAEGVAVDIGAGFGCFALPFARRYPRWQVWCFEPDSVAFAALSDNIERLGLSNVRALPVAVAGGGAVDPALPVALRAGDRDGVRGLCPPAAFRRHKTLEGFLDAGNRDDERFERVDLPTLPANALPALRPDLLKLMAPHAEADILRAFEGNEPAFLMGESWRSLPPGLLSPRTRAAWLPFARAPRLALRRTQPVAETGATDLGATLAVVIDAGAAGDAAIASTLAALPRGNGIEAHLVLAPSRDLDRDLVPGIGGEGLTMHHADQPGAPAAFNLGRRRSMSSHIAFLQAGDLPVRGSLQALMELAQLSGAEIVQGGGVGGPGWTDLPHNATFDLGGDAGAFLPAGRMMTDFAPSRARLYRRDFLDARALWFPEHLRCFADHHLHFLALQFAGDLPVLPGARIEQQASTGLLHEEALHLPEVFRLVIKRALSEGWTQLAPLFEGFARAARDTLPRLAPTLHTEFREALAEVLVLSEKALGPVMPGPAGAVIAQWPGLGERIERLQAERKALPDSYAWGWMDAASLHPSIVAQARLWQRTE